MCRQCNYHLSWWWPVQGEALGAEAEGTGRGSRPSHHGSQAFWVYLNVSLNVFKHIFFFWWCLLVLQRLQEYLEATYGEAHKAESSEAAFEAFFEWKHIKMEELNCVRSATDASLQDFVTCFNRIIKVRKACSCLKWKQSSVFKLFWNRLSVLA